MGQTRGDLQGDYVVGSSEVFDPGVNGACNRNEIAIRASRVIQRDRVNCS